MEILDYAMKMELDGKAFYEKSAAQTSVPELKNILLQLAEEELKHFHFFRQRQGYGRRRETLHSRRKRQRMGHRPYRRQSEARRRLQRPPD